MTEAVRCDRCKKLDDDYHGLTLIGRQLLARVMRPEYYPEKADLCGSCAEELRGMLTAWFSEPPGEEKANA